MHKKTLFLLLILIFVTASFALLINLNKIKKPIVREKNLSEQNLAKENSLNNINGTIFAIGGFVKDSAPATNTAEFFNLKTNKWQLMSPMNTSRAGTAVAAIGNKIYVFGGMVGNVWGGSKIVEEFDLLTNQWTSKNEMPHSRSSAHAISLGEKIYVFGGMSKDNLQNKSLDIYDPISDTWTSGSDFPAEVENYNVPWCQAADNNIYCPGLADHSYTLVFDPDQNTWTSLSTEGRTILYNPSWSSDGKVLYGAIFSNKVGGLAIVNSIAKYDPSVDKLTVRDVGNYIHNSYQAFQPLIVDNNFYLIGGKFSGPPVRDFYVFNLEESTSWEKTTPLIMARSSAGVIFLPIDYNGSRSEGGSIGGYITKNGKPVSGRVVKIYLRGDKKATYGDGTAIYDYKQIASTRTDTNGYYNFTSLKPGVYRVEKEDAKGDSSYSSGYNYKGNLVPGGTDITFNYKKQTSGIILENNNVINDLNYGVDWPSNYQDFPEKYPDYISKYNGLPLK